MGKKFRFNNGILQAADINPSAGGLTSGDLTKPAMEASDEVSSQLITGESVTSISPLVFIAVAVVVLFVIRYLQK